MSLTGSFTDCSIPEIFHLLEKGKKSGLLSIGISSDSSERLKPLQYIWVERGHLIAAAKELDYQGLLSQIERSQWVKNRVITKLVQLSCPLDQPLGLCLKQQGVLQTKQLKQLFQVQVLQQVCTLLDIKEGWFNFEQNVPIPRQEMTGLSIPATQSISSCRLRLLSENISEWLVKFSHARDISLEDISMLMDILSENSCTEEEQEFILRILNNANRYSRKQMKLA